MPSYRQPKEPKPFEIDKFLGVNESVGETQIEIGEATYMRNFRITNNFKAQKRKGFKTFIDCGNSKAVYFWYGKIGDKNYIVFTNDGKAYTYDTTISTETVVLADLITEGVVTQIGTLTDAKTSFIWFGGVLLLQNGVEYKYYDGTTFDDVSNNAYIPTTRDGVLPIGVTQTPRDLDEHNLLTPFEIQLCVGDGSGTQFQLPYTNIDATTLIVSIDGVSKTEGADFTVNRTTGIVTFTTAPAANASISIQFGKTFAGDLEKVTQNLMSIDFGPGNDTTLFMWGNPDAINRRIHSAPLLYNYFPINNTTDIGRSNRAITDIKVQQSNQLIFKESAAFRSNAEFNVDRYIYPVFDLNESTGNLAFGQARIIDNDVVTLHANSIHRWYNDQYENKTNTKRISDKIEKSLLEIELKDGITLDYQKKNEYWLNVDNIVYILNYQNDTFYMFDNINATQFREIDGYVHFGTLGTIERFYDEQLNDNGVAIEARMELGFTDLGVKTMQKNTRRAFVSIEPSSRTSLQISFATDRINLEERKFLKLIKFVLFDFSTIDFSDMSFETNRNPQRFNLRLRATKYVFIKFIFENTEDDETLTILDFSFKAEATREVK